MRLQPLQLNHQRFHLGIFGASGNGKTTGARNFLLRVRATCIFLFDAEGEFARIFGLKPCRTGAEIDAAVHTGWVCFDPHHLFPGELEAALVWFAKVVLQWSRYLPGRKFAVVDEFGSYVTPTNVPKPIKILFQTGRRYGIDMLLIGQQPNEIPDTILSQLTELVIFQLISDTPKTLNLLRKFRINPADVANLPPYHWISASIRGAMNRSTGVKLLA